ncbi:unnamed protein product [Periconia digitata]|uniref:Heterokaryon incompatibility domain-containing protein n=1 Tax=Periconia digitata TaxID=1303443 RepID=A0A9W4U3K2_9PLEO|nr:unnamed protein product [Periconia digitata]
MEVSCHLEAALHTLHSLPETAYGMGYWIDALCINQEDVLEKNHQVKRMMNIYALARAVVVWLGPEMEEDDKAIRAMNTTYRDTSQNNKIITPPSFEENDWDALYRFMKKPYWTRLWIVQELAANHNNTLFLCGTKRLTRQMIKMAADCCNKLLRDDSRFPLKGQKDIWSISRRMYCLVDLEVDRSINDTLGKVLGLSRDSIASDPRDKVYGIRGILPEAIASQIEPDYSHNITAYEVFTSLTTSIIKSTGNLNNIIYGAKFSTGWSSWVPDQHLPFPRNHVKYLHQSSACGNERARFIILDQDSTRNPTLCVKGIRVDAIDGIAASPTLENEPIYPRHTHERYKGQVANAIGKALILNHPKVRKNPALLKLPWDIENRISQSTWSDILSDENFQKFRQFQNINKDFPMSGQPFESYFPAHSQKRNKALGYHLRLAVLSLMGRKLITTTTGYIGLMPEDVENGDVIAVILGCDFPVLLRPFGTAYRVVGECYVHGIMSGEFFKARVQKEPYQDFDLV